MTIITDEYNYVIQDNGGRDGYGRLSAAAQGPTSGRRASFQGMCDSAVRVVLLKITLTAGHSSIELSCLISMLNVTCVCV